MGSSARRVVGHHNGQAGLEDSVDLDASETSRTPLIQVFSEGAALLANVMGERTAGGVRGHNEKIPRLGEAHARSSVGRTQDTSQNLWVNRFAGELTAHVTSSSNH